MTIRDRIVELRRVPARQLRANPRNWRTHPAAQREALRGVLTQIGYAGALLARELPDGSLELVDGHLRAETTPDAEVPVLVLDLDEQEAGLLLAVHDPLAAMAGADAERLAELVATLHAEDAAVEKLIDDLVAAEQQAVGLIPTCSPDVAIPESYQVVVHCRGEQEQRELFEELTGRGHKCRVLSL